MNACEQVSAREAFRRFAEGQGWGIETRDGLDDYFEERTFYAWLGFAAARGVST